MPIYLSFTCPLSFSLSFFFSNHGRGMIVIQPRANWDPGEITGGVVVEQSFEAAGNFLMQTELMLSSFGRNKSGELSAEIVGINGTALCQYKTPLQSIDDNKWHIVIEKPVPMHQGEKYLIRLTCPDSTKGNAITWRGSRNNIYLQGSAALNGSILDRDMAFALDFGIIYPNSENDRQ